MPKPCHDVLATRRSPREFVRSSQLGQNGGGDRSLKRLGAPKAVLIDFETQVVKVGRSPSFTFCASLGTSMYLFAIYTINFLN